jgi:hypothetical protein
LGVRSEEEGIFGGSVAKGGRRQDWEQEVRRGAGLGSKE